MARLVGLAKAMAFATTAVLVVCRRDTTTAAAVMLSTTGEPGDKDRDETTNLELPLPSGSSSSSSRSRSRSSRISSKYNDINDNKPHVSLLWRDPDGILIREEGRSFLGDRADDDEEEDEDEETVEHRENREKIKATIRKFYRGADPKFARASLASLKQKKKLQLLTATDGSTAASEHNSENGDKAENDDLLPGTVLEFLMEDHSYELVERMQLGLGATPQHYMDFAYKSVTASSSSSAPSSSSSAFRFGEDQATCNAMVPAESLLLPFPRSNYDEEGDAQTGGTTASEETDRSLAFFASWWKWWMPYANSQWWKDNGSSKTDYDIGKTPFAGGSNGEVWRGRRICHRKPPPTGGGSGNDGDPRSNGGSGSDSDSSRNSNGSSDGFRAFIKPHWWKRRRFGDDDSDDSHHDWAEPGFRQDDDEDDDNCDDQTPLVLKRLRIERGYLLLEAGLREVYFGKLIARVLEDTKQDMYTVYVDHFFREVPRRQQPRRPFAGLPSINPNSNHQQSHRRRANDLELWIVYEDAGPSLRSYIYSPIASENGFVMHQHSKLWTKLRTFSGEEKPRRNKKGDIDMDINDWDSSIEVTSIDEGDDADEPTPSPGASLKDKRNRDRKLGRLFLQKTLREVLAAAAELHKRGIVHRDIKPSNVMCQSEDQPVSVEELFESDSFPNNIVCKLGDFSSGWDRYTSEHLYTKGPTPGEQTDEYAPPESYVGPYWKPFDADRPQSYDSWSIGVLALELLLGTPNVFSVDQRTSALLTNKLNRARASEDEIAYALYLAALSNFCIFVPSSNETSRGDNWPLRYGDPLHKTAMVKESCTLQDFHRALRARDPLGIGFDSSTDLLLHLIWQLLAFDPSERMTAEEALQHPYFISPDGTLDSLHQIPGCQNAMVSEILEHRIDFDVEDEIKTFECPTCGRVFHDWQSCHQHANLRKHAKFCIYNHTVLPSCINTHSMLPEHPTSGYCDLQGRRKTIEDFHSIHLHHSHQFYGIFDGHTGNLASKFAASELYTELLAHLPDLMQIEGKEATALSNVANGVGQAWKEEIRVNVTRAFENVHDRFLDRITTMTTPTSEVGSAPKMDQSGTTATALLVTQDVVIAAVLGDSRGVLASANGHHPSTADTSSKTSRWKNFPKVSAIPFSIDHVASNPTERELVRQRGGFVSTFGHTARVNGTLAITRSIGDANLAPVLSREPHVRAFDRSELQDLCGDLGGHAPPHPTNDMINRTVIPCFAILASDGLWDVMSNQEAVDMVVEIILRHNEAHVRLQSDGSSTREVALVPSSDDDDGDSDDSIGPFQESAERLAVEAYVRGSTDNIGVCVVAID